MINKSNWFYKAAVRLWPDVTDMDEVRQIDAATAFYGVLDYNSGILTYANAGHNPPYLIRGSNGQEVQALGRTGIPLGMFEDMKWEKAQT